MLDTTKRKSRGQGDVTPAALWRRRKGGGGHKLPGQTGYHWAATVSLHTGSCISTRQRRWEWLHSHIHTHTPAFITHLVEFCRGKLRWGGPRSSNRSVLLTRRAVAPRRSILKHLNISSLHSSAAHTAHGCGRLTGWIRTWRLVGGQKRHCVAFFR